MRKNTLLFNLFIALLFYAGNTKAQCVVNAGPDRIICEDYVQMNGNLPLPLNEGEWNIISGTGYIINDLDPRTMIYGLSIGVNEFEWYISDEGSGDGDCWDNVIITVVPGATIADAGVDQTTCTGEVTLAANSTSGGETGLWTIVNGTGFFADPTSPTTSVTGLNSGINIFEWTITNPAGCSTSDQIEIVNNNPSIAYAGASQSLCKDNTILDGNNPLVGIGQWSVISGSATFTDANLHNTTITGLGQGTNILRWTIEYASCSNYDEVEIINNTPTIPNAGIDQTICSATASLSANTPTYGTGEWSLANGYGVFTDVVNPATTINDLDLGTNTLRWTITNNNCSLYDDVIIVNDLPEAPFAGYDQTTCIDSTSLEATALSIGNGQWSTFSGSVIYSDNTNPTTLITNIQQGTNSLVWTATNNTCTLTDTVIIINDRPTIPNAGIDQTICSATASLSANTPTYGTGEWSLVNGYGVFTDVINPATTINDLDLGTNTLRWTITNNNCSLYDDVIIVNDLPDAPFAGYDQTTCIDSTSLEATALSIGTGQWSTFSGSVIYSDNTNPATLITNIQQGTNSLVWTATNNTCTLTDTVIIINDRPTIPNAGIDQTICSATASLSANTPTYGTGEWSLVNGYATFDDVTSTDATALLLQQGDNTLRWTITNNACFLYDDVIITNDLPDVPNAGSNLISCTDSVTLNAEIPEIGNGMWSALNPIIAFNDSSLTNATAYYLPQAVNSFIWTLTNNACTLSDTMLVSSSQLQVSNTHTDLSCYNSNDGSIDITISGGFEEYIYNWFNLKGELNYITQDLNNIQADTYIVDIIDNNGCEISDTILVTQPTKILFNDSLSNVLCHNDSTGSIYLSPTGGTGVYNYSWTISDSTNWNVSDSTYSHITNLIIGDYNVTITDNSGCFVDTTFTVSQPSAMSLTATIIDNVCYNGYTGEIDLTVHGGNSEYIGYTYLWEEQNDSIVHYYNNLFSSTNEDINNLHAGNYTVIVSDLNGCTISETYEVSEPFLGISNIPEITDVSCKDQHDGAINLEIEYGTPPYVYNWSTGETNKDLEGLDGGVYIVTITDIYNCYIVDTINVNVTDVDCIHIYNSFSPNADGINDTWDIDNIYLYPDVIVNVFNQWGNKVFESTGYSKNWDGTFNGKVLPATTYYYTINLKNGDSPYSGHVTILK
ncbi:MAG: gliding motility-associated C-terminal domain-containing protein [Bacteroidales bacterium]|nr:gliding motility-associated C-terminal domain-containing protein [Bacteroidales bacterium]